MYCNNCVFVDPKSKWRLLRFSTLSRLSHCAVSLATRQETPFNYYMALTLLIIYTINHARVRTLSLAQT